MISAERIPNNVGLSGNKRLQRALEHWQPKYLQWWRDMGPQGFQDYHQVYVRTAVSVDPEGVIVTFDPAVKVTASCNPFKERTTWPPAIASGEAPVPAPARLTSCVTEVIPVEPPPV